VRILGQELQLGMRVRVTGFLARDCHGDWNHLHWTGECYEDDRDVHNVELHPVYPMPSSLRPTRGVSPRQGDQHRALPGRQGIRHDHQPMMGIPATGKAIAMSAINVVRLDHGHRSAGAGEHLNLWLKLWVILWIGLGTARTSR
jgi:hypothetical protein